MERGLSFYWFNDQQAIEDKESKIWLVGLSSGETFDSIDKAFKFILKNEDMTYYVDNLDFFAAYTLDFCERLNYNQSKGIRGILKKECNRYFLKTIGNLITAVELKGNKGVATFKSPTESITKNRDALKELMEQNGLDVSHIQDIKITDPIHRDRLPTIEEKTSAIAEAKGILYFKDMLEEEFPDIINHTIGTYTMEHLVNALTKKSGRDAYTKFREWFPLLGHDERMFYQNTRDYSFKGIMFCNQYSDATAILKYDRNNMYPFVMSSYRYPRGIGVHHLDDTEAGSGEFGFYKLDEVELNIPFPLPGIDENGSAKDYVMASPLFNYLRDNHLFDVEPKIIESYIYKARFLGGALSFFKDLYDRKIAYKKEGKFFLTDLLKQMSVVCYGKWSQCGYDKDGKNYDKPGFYEYLPIGVATVQYAWLDVLKIVNHPDLDFENDILYIDTDCVVYNKAKKDVVYEILKNKVGMNFGQWKLEADTDRFRFYGVKQYRYFDYTTNKEVDKMAGLGQLKTQQDWLETLNGVEHKLRYRNTVKGGKIYISENREVNKDEKR